MSTRKTCDCDICQQGDDAWCCRTCHDIARFMSGDNPTTPEATS